VLHSEENYGVVPGPKDYFMFNCQSTINVAIYAKQLNWWKNCHMIHPFYRALHCRSV
jgi:hypothetical protein